MNCLFTNTPTRWRHNELEIVLNARSKRSYELKVTESFNMQFEFTALQGAIYDLANLKQEFEQTEIFKLEKYIINMA